MTRSDFFARLREEIQADHDQLHSLMTRLGHEKALAQRADGGEIQSLKLGFATSGGLAGVCSSRSKLFSSESTGKKFLWRARCVRPAWPILAEMDLALGSESEDQADRVDAQRLRRRAKHSDLLDFGRGGFYCRIDGRGCNRQKTNSICGRRRLLLDRRGRERKRILAGVPLAASPNEKRTAVELVSNPSRTGWTTEDAIEHELPLFRSAGGFRDAYDQ